MSVKTVFFDLDGTILYTLPDLHDATNYALSLEGFPLRTIEETGTFLGNGVRNLVRLSLPEGVNEEAFERVLANQMDYYSKHLMDKTVPYDGILDVLQELKDQGIQLGVISNKYDAAVRMIVPHYFGDLFDVMTGEQDGIARKPDPTLIAWAREQLPVSDGPMVYVGDSDVDARTALGVGCPFLLATWGFRTKEQLKEFGEEHFVDAVSDLPHRIMELFK